MSELSTCVTSSSAPDSQELIQTRSADDSSLLLHAGQNHSSSLTDHELTAKSADNFKVLKPFTGRNPNLFTCVTQKVTTFTTSLARACALERTTYFLFNNWKNSSGTNLEK